MLALTYISIFILCLILIFLGFRLIFSLVKVKSKNWFTRFKVHSAIAICSYIIVIVSWGIHIIPQENINREVWGTPKMDILEYLVGDWMAIHIIGIIMVAICLIFDYRKLKRN